MSTAAVNGMLWGARAADWSDRQEALARPLYEHVFRTAGLTRGTRYLDAGCGAGLATQLAAEQGAEVSGIDAASALLSIARTRAPAGDFREGDLETLPYDDGRFDLVTGFNAFQYAGNPGRAVAEARRVTKAGGQVVIATWSPPELTQAAALLAALKPLLPPPPPGAPGPFALSDEAALRALTTNAGLTPVAVHDVDCPFVYPDLATAVRSLGSAGVAVKAVQHTSQEAVDRAHEDAARPFQRPDGSIFVQNRFRYLIARA